MCPFIHMRCLLQENHNWWVKNSRLYVNKTGIEIRDWNVMWDITVTWLAYITITWCSVHTGKIGDKLDLLTLCVLNNWTEWERGRSENDWTHTCWTIVGIMLGQRRKRWANINPTKVQGVLFIIGMFSRPALSHTLCVWWPFFIDFCHIAIKSVKPVHAGLLFNLASL